MSSRHKSPLVGWHPPADLSAWLRAEAERRDVPLSVVLTEACQQYRLRAGRIGGGWQPEPHIIPPIASREPRENGS